MELAKAEELLAAKRAHLAEQHRYIAQAQTEVAARMAIVVYLDFEEAWARGCRDAALGLPVDWEALREQGKRAQAQMDEDLSRARVAGKPWLLVDSE